MEGYAEPELGDVPAAEEQPGLSNYEDPEQQEPPQANNYAEADIELNGLVEQAALGGYANQGQANSQKAAYNYAEASLGVRNNYSDADSDILEYGYGNGYGAQGEAPDAPAPEPVAAGRDWLKEFWDVALVDDMQAKRIMEEFRACAVKVASKIVEERDLEDFARTVKPLQGAKGVAGGVKYLKDGIFFKFATDAHGIYGGDEFSSKAASQELLGQQHVLRWIKANKVPNAYVPLMTVCDVRGYRIIATSLLPLGKGSLKYGSDNGGETVHCSDPSANQLMADAGKFLNLKPHTVGQNLAVIHFPADIECHAGSDGRYYILDTARLWCPEAPSFVFLALLLMPNGYLSEIELPYRNFLEKVAELVGGEAEYSSFAGGKLFFQKQVPQEEEENSIASSLAKKPVRGRAVILPDGIQGKRLYMLLRPELIQSFPTPLSPDAFTAFASRDPDRLVHEKEVRSAFAAVLQQRIPALAAEIEANHVALVPGLISGLLHERGINVRHMALLRAQLPESCSRSKTILLIEMIARCFKVIVRSMLRNAHSLTEHEVYADSLNLFFGNSDASKNMWNISLRLQLSYKYGHYNVCVVPTDASLFDLRDAALPWEELLRCVVQQLHLSYDTTSVVQKGHVFVKEGFARTTMRARSTTDNFVVEPIDASGKVAEIDRAIDQGRLQDAYVQIMALRESLGVNKQCPLWVVILNLACKILVKIGRHDATVGKDFAQAFANSIRAMRMETLPEAIRQALFGQT